MNPRLLALCHCWQYLPGTDQGTKTTDHCRRAFPSPPPVTSVAQPTTSSATQPLPTPTAAPLAATAATLPAHARCVFCL